MHFHELIEVAVFYTIFNIVGLILFWPLKKRLASYLERAIPNIPEPKQLVDLKGEYTDIEVEIDTTPPRFLLENSLSSTQTATQAVLQELGYLSRISLEVICHILFLKTDVLSAKNVTATTISEYNDLEPVDADLLYRKHIKNLYSELLTYISKINYKENEAEYQNVLTTSQIIAFKLVSAVKNSHHLQKNLRYYLSREESLAQNFYIELRTYIVENLRIAYEIHLDNENNDTATETADRSFTYPRLRKIPLSELIDQSREFESQFRNNVYSALKENKINGFTTSSILNDLNYSTQIVESLFNILKIVAIQEDNLLQNIDVILDINNTNI